MKTISVVIRWAALVLCKMFLLVQTFRQRSVNCKRARSKQILSIMNMYQGTGRVPAAAWLGPVCLVAWPAIGGTASAMVYKTPTGTLKDNCVVWHNGTFHLLTMYREQIPGGEEHWDNAFHAMVPLQRGCAMIKVREAAN